MFRFHIVMIQIQILNILFKYANTVAIPHHCTYCNTFQSRNLSRTLYRNRSVNDMAYIRRAKPLRKR